MPTYEYECQRCGHTFERFQSITEEKLKRCPECRGKLKRLLGTGAGIIFKGSGFYETDYKRKSSGNGSASRYTPKTEKKEAEKKEAQKSEPSASKKADD